VLSKKHCNGYLKYNVCKRKFEFDGLKSCEMQEQSLRERLELEVWI
jgi:hypothetical protein